VPVREQCELIRNQWAYDPASWSRGFQPIEDSIRRDLNVTTVAGIDEAGRGPWAGPVVAAAVVLEDPPGLIKGLKDSKQLSAKQRDQLYDIICRDARAWGVGIVSAGQIDACNIVMATRFAMMIAFNELFVLPDILLIDGRERLDCTLAQISLVKGDARCVSIAAASIIAKVTRDRIMVHYEKEYPGYHFAKHKGYGTKLHQSVLNHKGPSPIHRMTYSPVQKAAAHQKLKRFVSCSTKQNA